MSYRHTYKSQMFVLEKELVDTEVMEPVADKVVAMIDPLMFDPGVMAIVGHFKKDKPLMKAVLPSELVDDDSVEIAGELVVVWADSDEVEFNPATMEKVTWGKDLEVIKTADEVKRIIPADYVGRHVRNSIQQAFGKFEGDFREENQAKVAELTIKEDKVLKDLYMSCIVAESVKVTVNGDVYGPLTMKKGSFVLVKGDTFGPITNDGGDLEIEGDIMGPITNLNGGSTKFEDEAEIMGPIKYID